MEGDISRSYPASSVEGSPARHERRDSAHLTAAATPQPLPSALDPDSNSNSTGEKRSRWGGFLDGAKNLLDSIIDMGASDSDSPRAPTGPSAAHRAEMTTSPRFAYPAVAGAEAEPAEAGPLGDTTAPALLRADPSNGGPALSEPSTLLDAAHLRALAAEVPLRYRQAHWRLVYSTQRDGISMATMLRNARGRSPTVLVVRDMGRHVFGAFCSEPWKVSPRYFGTGETFVFQTQPRQVAWHWWWQKMRETQNDFFMWGESGALAVGGAGGYALWIDEELAHGISRTSATFGNDSLSSTEEFRIGAVELWWLD